MGGGGEPRRKGSESRKGFPLCFTTSYVRACHGAVGLLLPAAMWRRYASHGGPVRQRLGGGGGKGVPECMEKYSIQTDGAWIRTAK